ncbi:MAG: hypothetical protein VYD50_01200 [Candidatus Thermoplasmatota archaeon]|nr:hypothetical protein [Candidatus Thermoplasmatota archaeon]
MDPLRVAIVLVHPIAALTVIWLFFRQHGWRDTSIKLRGDARRLALNNHESMGDKIALATVVVVALAFSSKTVRGILDNEDATSYLLPGHFHGWAGLIGLVMMLILWRLGRKVRDEKTSGHTFARSKEIHGKFSDLIAILVVIHAFLGFLYLLTIL